MIGYPEMIVILVLALLLFGPDKLPEIARSLGRSAKEFKSAQMEAGSKINNLKEHQDGTDEKIYKLAIEIGIYTKNKTTEQLIEEIRAKVRTQTDK